MKSTNIPKPKFCENCGISVSIFDYVELEKTKTETNNKGIIKKEYKDKTILCKKCSENYWFSY